MSWLCACASARRLAYGCLGLCLGLMVLPLRAAGLSWADALETAQQEAPALRGSDAAIAGAQSARSSAAALPAPRLSAGIDNLPISGADRFSAARDSNTMQRLALSQEVPNGAKRDARQQVAQARVERERAQRVASTLAVRRDVALAWLALFHAQRRLAALADLQRDNRLQQQTLPARVAAGSVAPAELTLARQEALTLADRADELEREQRRARAELRRWVGVRADEALLGQPQIKAPDSQALRSEIERQPELASFLPMRAIATAEMTEADAEQRGDWSWQVAYSRRPRYDDMVSFQFSIDLPWQRQQRSQPLVEAKRREVQRIDAEREDVQRRQAAALEVMLAEHTALQAQLERAQGPGLALAQERAQLLLAAYQSGRADLGAVWAARAQALEARLRAIDLEAQRDALRVRLNSLSPE